MPLYAIEMKSVGGPEAMARRCRSSWECPLIGEPFLCPLDYKCKEATAEQWAARLIKPKDEAETAGK